MIDKMLITVFCLIVGLAITMQMFFFSLLLFKRLEFDMICHSYAIRMDEQGGLTAEQENELFNQLSRSNFVVQHIEATSQGEYGLPMLFEVTASWSTRQIRPVLTFTAMPLSFAFSADLLCRVMHDDWQS